MVSIYLCICVYECVCVCVCVCQSVSVNFLPVDHSYLINDQIEIGMSFLYALGRFIFKFHKYWMSDDNIVASLKFHCSYLYCSIEIQTLYSVPLYNNGKIKDLKIKVKVTSTKAEGHRWRSKVKKIWTNGHIMYGYMDIMYTILPTDIIPGTKVQYNKRNLMT